MQRNAPTIICLFSKFVLSGREEQTRVESSIKSAGRLDYDLNGIGPGGGWFCTQLKDKNNY